MTRAIAAVVFLLFSLTPARAEYQEGITTSHAQYIGAHFLQHRPFAKPKKAKVAKKRRRSAYAARPRSLSLAGFPAPLVAKVAQIVSTCGSRIASGYRPGARTPSGHLSLHATRQAVDVVGNPGCIYPLLRNWPGGYSTDYHSAPGGKHVHISYAPKGSEWGLRFAHRHPVRRWHEPAVTYYSAAQ